MANITLHSDSNTSATSVSNVFIDEYMSDANGEFVKIYLYLLRQLNAPNATFSITAMADKFEHTEKDIKRALSYWERMNLLRLEYDADENLTSVCFLETSGKNKTVSAQNNPKNAQPQELPKKKTQTIDFFPSDHQMQKNYCTEDIYTFQAQETIQELLFIAERYLGRMLDATDMNTIFYWYDTLGFSADLIEYLIEHCVTTGHKSIRYIHKVAMGWAEKHITTVDQAKQEANSCSQISFAVRKALGITGRSLIPTELAWIEKWQSEYGFSQEIITAACERTIERIHQPKFEYIESILKDWKKQQVKTLDDIHKLDEQFQKKTVRSSVNTTKNNTALSKNKFNNFEQRSYDFEQLEKILLNTTL